MPNEEKRILKNANLGPHLDLYIPTPVVPLVETAPPFCSPAMNELNSLMARRYRKEDKKSFCFLLPPLSELSG